MNPAETRAPVLSKAELNVLEVLMYVPESDKWWSAADISRGGRGPLPAGAQPIMAKDTAIKAAALLAEKGLVGVKDTPAVRKSTPSPHYFLSSEPRDSMNVVAAYLQTLLERGELSRCYRLLESTFGRRALTGDFVRQMLVVRRAPALVKLPVSRFKLRLYEDDGVTARTVATPTDIPVRPPELSVAETVRQVAENFKKTTLEVDRGVVDETLRRHYESEEDHLLIQPLLALISVSPQALAHFMGPWEPHAQIRDNVRSQLAGRVEHVLYSMVYGALYDVASSRVTPGSVVRGAEGSPRSSKTPSENSPLLELTLYSGATITYSAGFRAPIMVMPSPYGLVRVAQNPADGWAQATWADPPVYEEEGEASGG